ncbi:MAG: leucine-rich repeat domain-containing protein [Chitinophagales bacterium]
MKNTLLLLFLLPLLSFGQTEEEAFAKIRKALEYPDTVTVLDLSGYQLMFLPEEIGQLVNLKELDLSGNQFTSLPKELGRLTNLLSLNLSSNQLTSLPVELSNLNKLQVLNLSYNSFKDAPEVLNALPSLVELDCGGFLKYPETDGLGRLKYGGNKISSDAFTNLPNLVKFNLCGNAIEGNLPLGITQMHNLQELCLDGAFSLDSGQLPKLKKLTAYGEWIGYLKNLEELNTTILYADSNSAAWLSNLQNLRVLNLNGSGMSSIPSAIGQLQNLNVLNLGDVNNHRHQFHNSFAFNETWLDNGTLKNIKILNLSCANLDSIPKKIGELTNLTHLDLSDNQINEIPKEIGNLTQLEVLNLSGCGEMCLCGWNKISSIPKELSLLTNLKELYFSHTSDLDPMELSQLKWKLPNCEIHLGYQ